MPPSDVERMPIWMLDAHIRTLAEIFKAEDPKSLEGKAEQDFT